jgi:hypothetical protein
MSKALLTRIQNLMMRIINQPIPHSNQDDIELDDSRINLLQWVKNNGLFNNDIGLSTTHRNILFLTY